MNNKIKELAKEAKIYFEEDKANRIHFVTTETLNRFAELIIRECAQATIDLNRGDISGYIMEHFDNE